MYYSHSKRNFLVCTFLISSFHFSFQANHIRKIKIDFVRDMFFTFLNSVLNSNSTSHELPRRYLHKTFNLIEHSTCIRIESLNDVGHLKIALIRINYTIPFKCKFKEKVNRKLKLKCVQKRCLAFYITVEYIF